jgi:hypothetical protein
VSPKWRRLLVTGSELPSQKFRNGSWRASVTMGLVHQPQGRRQETAHERTNGSKCASLYRRPIIDVKVRNAGTNSLIKSISFSLPSSQHSVRDSVSANHLSPKLGAVVCSAMDSVHNGNGVKKQEDVSDNLNDVKDKREGKQVVVKTLNRVPRKLHIPLNLWIVD